MLKVQSLNSSVLSKIIKDNKEEYFQVCGLRGIDRLLLPGRIYSTVDINI